jgi:uncharacterized protein
MIIDFHTHVFPPRIINNREVFIGRDPLFSLLYSNPKAKLASVEDLIASMDSLEIDKSVALNIQWSSPELCRETNDYISESISRYPDRLVGFGMVVFDFPETAISEIERCIKNGIRGIGEIRLTPQLLINTTLLEPVIRKLIDSHLILLTHTSEPIGHLYPGKGDITPEALYPFISAFPGLKLVCAHWGGGLPFYKLMPEVKKALENVYFDSAASPYLYNSQVYNQVAQLAGADRILFSSDYPLLSPKRLLNEINALDIPAESRELILSGNARKLLGLN